MGIIARFKDIMAANINALLDRAEDPEKMIDQYLKNLEADLVKVKQETASVIADEKNAKRKLDECDEEIAKMTEYAKKAVIAGRDDEAKAFLQKKTELAEKRTVLLKNYEMACEGSMKMRQMHDKLETDISSLKTRRDTLKAKVKVAETQKKMNQLGSGLSSAGDHLAAFDKMEEKVNRMLDEADAMAELNAVEASDSIADLTKKYEAESQSSEVDDELAALKAELGM